MARKTDNIFEIGFFESILKRSPNYPDVVEILGGLYTKVGRIQDGLKMDRKMVRLQPDNPTAHYNLACSMALCNRPLDAFKALRHAVGLGYSDAAWMREDPDLASLHGDVEFAELLARVEQQT